MREVRRSGHFREDLPAREEKNWFCWITIGNKEGKP
ncbi:MAG: hypothetical protein JXA46_09470 [Dehalococcoidales bacterium]|nr:hypothetical protein [Dehalococcoidales bacterium]